MGNKTIKADSRHLPTSNAERKEAERSIVKKAGLHSNKVSGLSPVATEFETGNSLASIKHAYLKNNASNLELNVAAPIIIDTDDRDPVPVMEIPYRAVCLLVITGADNKQYLGTGFFVSDKCVITAGHNVFFNGAWAKKIIVVGGSYDQGDYFGRTESSDFQSVAGWTVNGDINFDYGAVFLATGDIQKKANYFFSIAQDTNGDVIKISGYGVDKRGEQYADEGPVSKRSKFRIFYNLDTMRGNSGSPIFTSDQSLYTAIGIHTRGDIPNSGIRFTENVIKQINNWIKI